MSTRHFTPSLDPSPTLKVGKGRPHPVRGPGEIRLVCPETLQIRRLDEIAEGQRLGHLGDFDGRFIQRIRLTRDEASRAKSLEETLGPGEAACLAIAATRGIVVLTDDRDARTVAGSLGIQVSGTLGVLFRLVELGVFSLAEADTLLAAMMRAGYRSPVASLTEIS